MDYQNKLLELLKIVKDNDSNYSKYQDLINSLDKNTIYYNPYFVKNPLFHKYYNELPRIINNKVFEKDEITNFILLIKNLVIEEYQIILNKYKKIEQAIFNSDKEILIEFIYFCFTKKYIKKQEYFELSKYIMFKEEKIEELPNEIIIDENTLDLSLEFKNIFKNYGFDFDLIPLKEKKKLLKYAKIDNVKEVLSFLSYTINSDNFLERIKIITDLIIFYDRISFNKIKEFLANNDCSMNTLLGIGTIFFQRDINFKFRKLVNGGYEEKDAPKVIPQGNFDNFMYIINLLKKDKITDEDLDKKNILFTFTKEVISKNLAILNRYGIIDNNLPKTVMILNTKNTEYLLDRYIEAGLYDYLKEKQPVLKDDTDVFRWFKIKRARLLNDNISATHGIKQIYLNDDELYGMSKTDTGIRQVIMNDELLSKGKNSLNIQKVLPKIDLFNRYFSLRIVTPTSIFKADNKGESYPEYGIVVEKAFLNDCKNNIENEIINYLDNLKIFNIPVKRNDYEYQFCFSSKNGNALTNVIISRQKVIKLTSLLKQANIVINKDTPDIIKENLVLSVLLKDTIITYKEIASIRGFIRSTINKLGGLHDRFFTRL